MDLAFNTKSPFTRWVVKSQLLNEGFTVVDVGVQGGENPRWHLLGDYLTIHGFDAIREVIDSLQHSNVREPRRYYHWMAAGSADEDRVFYFNANDPCSSSFFQQGDDRFQSDANRAEQARQVKVRRLDTLLADGTIAAPDFLKVDVEGFEKDVFLGATETLRSVIGVETESNFGISPIYPKSHFATVQELLLGRGLLVFDLNFNRIPRATFQQALQAKRLPLITDNTSVGKPATLNVLFCRDLIAEAEHPENYSFRTEPPNADKIIKAMIVYELHGLSDIALDTAVRFRDLLGTRLDVDLAVDLLADPNCHPHARLLSALTVERAELAEQNEELWARLRNLDASPAGLVTTDETKIVEFERQIAALKASTSWRVTAPLRAVRRLMR